MCYAPRQEVRDEETENTARLLGGAPDCAPARDRGHWQLALTLLPHGLQRRLADEGPDGEGNYGPAHDADHSFGRDRSLGGLCAMTKKRGAGGNLERGRPFGGRNRPRADPGCGGRTGERSTR